MARPLIYDALRKKSKSNGPETIQLKQNLQSLKTCLTAAEKHHRTHVAIVECLDLILRQHAFIDTAKSIFSRCKRILSAQAGFIALIEESGKSLEVVYLDDGGLPTGLQSDSSLPIRGFRQETLQKKTTLSCNNFHKSKWFKLLPKGHIRLDNVLLAPLVIDDVSVGLLGFANKPSDFDEDDIRIASSFAKLTAQALSSSKAWPLLRTSLVRE